MGLGLTLIVMGLLLFLDRMGAGYGLREGWPWLVLALGVGSILQNSKSMAAWFTAVIGVFILGARYYSIHISFPSAIKAFFLPAVLVAIGIVWILRRKKD